MNERPATPNADRFYKQRDQYNRLRASHDRLLAAAKKALVADDSDYQIWADLKTAITAAEELAP